MWNYNGAILAMGLGDSLLTAGVVSFLVTFSFHSHVSAKTVPDVRVEINGDDIEWGIKKSVIPMACKLMFQETVWLASSSAKRKGDGCTFAFVFLEPASIIRTG